MINVQQGNTPSIPVFPGNFSDSGGKLAEVSDVPDITDGAISQLEESSDVKDWEKGRGC